VKRFLLLIFFLSIVSIQNFSFAEESNQKAIKSNRIDNYEILSISQPGSLFYSVTNGIIKSAINLKSNLTFIGRANVGLEKVIDINNVEKLTTRENYLYSLSIKTIHNDVSDLFYSKKVSESLINNEIIISDLTANLYSLAKGDSLFLIGLNQQEVEVVVGEIIPDSEIGWFEGVVNKDLGYKLGINRNIQAIIWGNKITENHLIEIHRNIKYEKIKLTGRNSIPNRNWVLPTALVKEMFGDFQIKERDGTWITIDKAWKDENIETRSVPILGRITCHRLMWEPLLGAFNQIIEENLESGLSKEQFKTSGGCYAPRRINRFDAGGSISRHAWGIAIDINTKTGYKPRIVEIFNDWGFAWGGTWTSPDAMHFELRSLSASISQANK
tara:strand:- start:802 stop:1956 length:1155 start_codon:yes stop_codon:yes gene_type:complete